MPEEAGVLPVLYRGEGFALAVIGDEALVVADPAAVEAVIAGIALSEPPRPRQARHSAPTDAIAALSSVLGLAATGGELFRLAPETAAKLADGHEFISEVGGRISGQLRQTTTKNLAGSAAFDRVSLLPSQALSLQMAMTTIALRVAIADVQRAVEAVGADVEVIRRRMESRQFGDVVADYETLRALVDSLESTGRLSTTDWGTVAALGPRVRRDLRSLREFVFRELTHAARGGGADDRADALDRVEALRSDLELMSVAEASLYLWHVLRVQHLSDTEFDHVPAAIGQARADLAANRDSDRTLLGELRALGASMTQISALEYHRFLSRRELAHDVVDLNEMLESFASHRALDYEPIPDVDQPTAREAIDAAQVVARGVASVGSAAARDAATWVRSRAGRGQKAIDPVQALEGGQKALGPGESSNIPTIPARDQVPVERRAGSAGPSEERFRPDEG